jgi:linoleoyl-CoA desaturase
MSTDIQVETDRFAGAVRHAVAELELLPVGRAVRRRQARRAAVVLAWFLGSWAALVYGSPGALVGGLLVVSLGMALAGLFMVIAHDAVHRSFGRSLTAMRFLTAVGGPGLSRGWWQAKHNRLHHGHTNVTGMDDDLDLGAIARVTPSQPWRPWHRWQHLYLWLFYPLLFVAQVAVSDVRYLAAGRVGLHDGRRLPWRARIELWLDKLLVPAVLIGVALTRHDLGSVALVTLAAMLVTGTVLSLVFVAEHTVEGTCFDHGDTGWMAAQVRSSADYATGNRLLTAYLGGLNHHIEHHLFPRLPHVVLPEVAPVVRRVCAEQGVPYHEFPTMRAALAAHYRHLRTLGRP